MDAVKFDGFTRVVFSLNSSPLATPFACKSSYFVDVPDQLTTNLQPYFAPVCKYIDEARDDDRKPRILVHCQHGQSRSGALAVCYVMHHKRCNLRTAIEITHKRRPHLKMNVAFLSQLQAWEAELGKAGNKIDPKSPSISLEECDKMGICKCYSSIKDPGAVCVGQWPKGHKTPGYCRKY